MFKLLVFVLLVTIINSEVIEIFECSDNKPNVCEIKEIRVDPCKEAKNKKPCKIKSGTNATIEFDYVLHFDAQRLLTQAYSATGLIDLPLIGMDRDGCKYTPCPTKSGETGHYKNSLFIAPAFPLLNYNVKWRIWDADEGDNGCCFTFKIKIVR